MNGGTCADANMTDANLEISQDGTTIEGYFESAWSPPLNAIMHYEMANPDVDIHCKYYEPANDFIGPTTVTLVCIILTRSFWETDPMGKDLMILFML